MEKIDRKLLENKEYLNFGQQCLGVIRKLLIALIEDHLEQEQKKKPKFRAFERAFLELICACCITQCC